MSRRTQTMIHGVRPNHTSRVVGGGRRGGGGGIVAADSSRVRKAGEVQISAGCQTFRKPIRQAIDTSEGPMSTIQGFTELEIRNGGMAKETQQKSLVAQT